MSSLTLTHLNSPAETSLNPVKAGFSRLGFFFLVLHFPLALLLNHIPFLATLHALIVLMLGLFWASSGKKLEHVLYIVGYIMGAEVMWRMCQASIFWEFGKYSVSAILLLSLLRCGRHKPPILPLMYLLLLLPGVIITFVEMSVTDARRNVSFNLSGPLSLFFCLWFFDQFRISAYHLRRLFLVVISPILGVVAITLFSIYTANNLNFTNNSNFITSGGFGPNQVSAMLGLGALLSFFAHTLTSRTNGRERLIFLVLTVVFTTQCLLTFSRGGAFLAFGGGTAGYIFLFRERQLRSQVISVVFLLIVLSVTVIFPYLVKFTEGWISVRYSDYRATGRLEIMIADYQIWKDHPILGIGAGQSARHRRVVMDNDKTAHTEFSRILAEHGVFGIAAVVFLYLSLMRSISDRRSRSKRKMAFSVAFLTWGILFLIVNAMRLVAPSLILGLATARLFPEDRC